MTWLIAIKAIAAVLTVVVLWLLAKELGKAIKESNEGRTSDKCDLD